MCAPVLFIIFNRIDTSARVFERIRAAAPAQLFIAADGARPDKNEQHACQQTRDLIHTIDWPCEVQTFFLNENLGPRTFIGKAISWFFHQVEEGIILEHDCLPHPDFFNYCTLMLEKYRNHPKVMHVSGTQFQDTGKPGNSILFSHYNHIWGWASWKRAWAYYDPEMKSFPDFERNHKIEHLFPTKAEQQYWMNKLSACYQGKIKSWDYQWTLAIWNQSACAILPGSNLVSNIGFDGGALHTKDKSHFLSNRPVYPFHTENLIFPAEIQINRNSEWFDFRHVFYPPLLKRLRNWIAAKL